ncbi:branched-chain amino acid ABC transporter permease [Ilumatobacter sp.]|uniref:branched-chain amino acid ABC transporter permease n=1 Tax=Ilumatobacter sp. TaxID=1967498 RepID=UPI003C627F37
MPTNSRTLAVAIAFVALVLLPLIGSDFFIDFVMTRTLMLGLAASTIVFLSAYGGMDSLAQWLIFGVAGFAIGNLVAESGRGLKFGWEPWLAAPIALAVATFLALILGTLSARSTGIYFLMLTLTYAVIGFYFFGQVTTFSGFGGMTGIDPPDFFSGEPKRLYYAALVLSGLAYVAFRLIARTPFGMALQGVRDDPVRMESLGFNVQLHRTLAFTLAGFVAGIAGVLNIWWNGQIDPTSIGINPTLDLFIIAVIGGIVHLEGAWLGAFVFLGANIYLRDIPGLGSIGGVIHDRILAEERFNTVVGLILLIIMLTSPDGLAGMIARVRDRLRGKKPDDDDHLIDIGYQPTSHTPLG